MRQDRVSLGWAMGALVVLAIAFAALTGPSPVSASALYSLDLTLILAAGLVALANRGRLRLGGVGFALFGGAYLGIAFAPSPWLNDQGLRPPPLFTTVAVDALRASAPSFEARWPRKVENTGWRSEQFAVTRADLPFAASNTIVTDTSPYKQVAHGLAALLFGGLGALVGAFADRANRPRGEGRGGP